MRATVHNLKSYAKINLSLNVIGKRKPNKLHSIETFVSLINLADEIKINEVDSKNHKVIFIGKFSKAEVSMGIHHDYKSKRGERAMAKQQKREAKFSDNSDKKEEEKLVKELKKAGLSPDDIKQFLAGRAKG